MNESLLRFTATLRGAPDRIALIDATHSAGDILTYADLDERVGQVAAALLEKGCVTGGRVALSLPNSLDLALLYLACLRLGLTAVPVSPDHPIELRAYMLGLVKPQLIVLGEDKESLGDYPLWRLTGAGSLMALPAAGSLPAWSQDVQQPLLIAFTSGTTSRPKAVCHAAGRMIANVEAFNSLTGINQETRMLHVMPMSYMAGFLNCLLSPLVAGGSVVLAPAFDAGAALTFWEAPRRHHANCMWLSPTMAALLVRLNRDPTVAPWTRDHLALVFAGTAPLPPAIRDSFAETFGCRLLESWGMTEVLLGAVMPSTDHRGGSAGMLLNGVAIQTRNTEMGAALPQEEPGELWVRSSYALLGYLDDDGNIGSDSADTNGWFPTGDLGAMDQEGYLSITGRKKDLIIRGGTNISPRAVEEVLLHIPGVVDAAVVGIPHPFWGEDVIAYIQIDPGASLPELEPSLRKNCREALPVAAMPCRFVAVTEFPRTSTGKIQKHRLGERL